MSTIDGDHHFIITGFPPVSLLVKITCEHLSNHAGTRCCCMTTAVNCKQWSPSRTEISKTYLSTRPHAGRDRRSCSVPNFIPSRTFSLSLSLVCVHVHVCTHIFFCMHGLVAPPRTSLLGMRYRQPPWRPAEYRGPQLGLPHCLHRSPFYIFLFLRVFL